MHSNGKVHGNGNGTQLLEIGSLANPQIRDIINFHESRSPGSNEASAMSATKSS